MCVQTIMDYFGKQHVDFLTEHLPGVDSPKVKNLWNYGFQSYD